MAGYKYKNKKISEAELQILKATVDEDPNISRTI